MDWVSNLVFNKLLNSAASSAPRRRRKNVLAFATRVDDVLLYAERRLPAHAALSIIARHITKSVWQLQRGAMRAVIQTDLSNGHRPHSAHAALRAREGPFGLR